MHLFGLAILYTFCQVFINHIHGTDHIKKKNICLSYAWTCGCTNEVRVHNQWSFVVNFASVVPRFGKWTTYIYIYVYILKKQYSVFWKMARHSKCPFHPDWKWPCSEFWAMQKPYNPKTGLELNIHKPKKYAQMQINTPIKTNWKNQNTIFRSMCNPWCFKWCFLHSIKLASQTSCFTFPGASNVLGISFQQSPVATRQNSNKNAHLKDMASQRANVWLRVLLGWCCQIATNGWTSCKLWCSPFGGQNPAFVYWSIWISTISVMQCVFYQTCLLK